MAGGSGSVRMAVLLVAITVMLHSAQEVFGISGKELEGKITNKCDHYKKNSQKDSNHVKVDCKAFLDKFKSAFVNKDPKKITPEAYNPLMENFKLLEHKDKYLFWSGTANLINWLKEKNNRFFYHVDDTVFGFLNMNIPWCGKEGSQEIFTEGCPGWNDPTNPVKSYWKRVSRAFAQAATGKVTVLLNNEKFYDSNSIFATDELPNFNSNKVTELRVLIVIQSEKTKERCEHSSLKQLKKSAGALEGKYSCSYIPRLKLNGIHPDEWWDTASPEKGMYRSTN